MPTANPVPSTDPSDLLFNAGKLDEVVNGTANSFTDRLGVARRTVAGMNADFDAQLADAESDLNVYRADAAASAAEALGYLQTIRATSYGAYASDPATDPLGNPPTVGDEYFNTTANLLKRWNGTTWQASDINTANLAASSGSSLVGYDGGTVQDVLDAVTGPNGAASVGYQPAGTGAVATNVQSKLQQFPTIFDVLTVAERNDVVAGTKTIDLTAKINTALAENRSILFKSGKYLINPDVGVNVPSNTHIWLEPGVEFCSSASSDAIYDLVKFHGTENSMIWGYGARVVGDRAIHVGTTGEFGYGVSFRGCKDIFVYGLQADDCWGDGYFFGNSGAANTSADGVTLIDVGADNNRRQGCSITSCKNLTLVRPRFTNTNGTPPEAGIDIEPNYTYDHIQNVQIIDPYTKGNNGAGIVVNIAQLDATSPEVSVFINNHKSIEDVYGFLSNSIAMGGLKGLVEYSNSKSYDTRNSGIGGTYWDSNGPRLEIHRPKVVRPNNAGLSSALYGAGIMFGRTVGETGAPGQVNGNILITNPSIIDDRPTPKMTRCIVMRDSVANFSETRVIDPIDGKGYTAQNPMNINDGAYILDTLGVLKRSVAVTANAFLNAADLQATVYDNAGQTVSAVLEYTLPSAAKWKGPRTFNVLSAYSLRVKPLSGDSILDENGSYAGSFTSSVVGSSLVIESINDTQWQIIRKSGSWGPSSPSSGFTRIGSVNYDPPSIAANGTVVKGITVIGAAVGDIVVASFSQLLQGVRLFGEVVSADVVNVTFWNSTATAVDLPSGVLSVRVVKP